MINETPIGFELFRILWFHILWKIWINIMILYLNINGIRVKLKVVYILYVEYDILKVQKNMMILYSQYELLL